MWIECLELIQFGSSTNEKVDFGRNAINLVEEARDEDRMLVPGAVLAVLYGFDSEDISSAKHPLVRLNAFCPADQDSGAFAASVDCVYGGRRFKISRNFNNGQVMIFDLTDQKRDVSKEFLKEEAGSLGERLTGLPKEEFLARCMFVSDKPEAQLNVSESTWTAFRSVVSRLSPSYSKAKSVEVLESYLNQFPYKEITLKVDFLIEELEKQRFELKQKLNLFERQRQEMRPTLQELARLNQKLDQELKDINAQEYFRLCLRAAEIDGQILVLKAQHIRCKGMEQELARIGKVESFPIESQKQIEELWTRRESKIDDYRALVQEVSPRVAEYESYEKQVAERWERLLSFTPEQAGGLKDLAEKFAVAKLELDELVRKRSIEETNARKANVDLARYEEVRRTMLVLAPKDATDAKSYGALIAGFRKQLSASERGMQRSKAKIEEIEDERRAKTDANAVLKIFKPAVLRQPELEAAYADLTRHTARIEDLKDRITNLENRIEDLANKAGVGDAAKLLEHTQEYSAAGPQFKELERLDQLLAEKRAICENFQLELTPYFKQAARQGGEINPQNALRLSEDVFVCMDDLKALNNSYSALNRFKQQLEFLSSEIKGLDDLLRSSFSKASLDETESISESYREFYGKVAKYYHWQALEEELAKAKEKFGFAPGSDEMHSVLADLEQERSQSWRRIHELVDYFPEIAEQTPPEACELESLALKPIAPELMLMREKRDDLKRRLKTFFDEYDEQMPRLLSTIATIERELNVARESKLALGLAREVLEQLLIDDLNKLSTSVDTLEDTAGESLPLIVDTASLAQDEVELSLALRFFITVIAPKRQVILLNGGRKFALSRLSSIIQNATAPVNFVWRKPFQAKSFRKRA